MSRTIVLDAGPLGLATNPKRSPQSLACAQWLQALVASGARVILPETTNVGHLSRFVPAELWQNVKPS